MRTYLVMANQTLGGQELHDAIRERIERGPCEFTVAVPVTKVRDLVAPAGVPGSGAAFPIDATAEDRQEKAWAEARNRMNHLVGEIRDLGASASGQMGDADPWSAFKDITQFQDFDEVIISTLPSGISKWLGMDLPSRVERAFDGPVTTIISGG